MLGGLGPPGFCTYIALWHPFNFSTGTGGTHNAFLIPFIQYWGKASRGRGGGSRGAPGKRLRPKEKGKAFQRSWVPLPSPCPPKKPPVADNIARPLSPFSDFCLQCPLALTGGPLHPTGRSTVTPQGTYSRKKVFVTNSRLTTLLEWATCSQRRRLAPCRNPPSALPKEERLSWATQSQHVSLARLLTPSEIPSACVRRPHTRKS